MSWGGVKWIDQCRLFLAILAEGHELYHLDSCVNRLWGDSNFVHNLSRVPIICALGEQLLIVSIVQQCGQLTALQQLLLDISVFRKSLKMCGNSLLTIA